MTLRPTSSLLFAALTLALPLTAQKGVQQDPADRQVRQDRADADQTDDQLAAWSKGLPIVERLRPAKAGKVEWELGDEPVDAVFVLASLSDQTCSYPGLPPVLADAQMVKVLIRPALRSRFAIEVPPVLADLHVQAVLVLAEKAQWVTDEPGELPICLADGELDADGIADDLPPAFTQDEEQPLFDLAYEGLELDHFAFDSLPPRWGLRATFIANSDSFALKEARRSRDADGRLQVWLWLKVPGAGEGQRDIVERHELLLDLGKGSEQLDVHVALTDGHRESGFRPFASFGKGK